ncbi:MAG: helix-turn-helix domain-containing protein [Mycobacterium sp.]
MATTEQRILDATVAEAAASGLERLTMDAVARRAGVNRVTVYRYFGDRDSLVAAMAARDTTEGLAVLAAAQARADNPLDATINGVVDLLAWARAHPFITRAAREEPGWLIAAGMSDDGAMLRRAVEAGAAVIATWYCGPASPEQIAETLARLLVSFILLPAIVSVDLDDEVALRGYVRNVVAPVVSAPGESR